MIKRKIQARFDAASNSYDDAAHIQRKIGGILVEKLLEFDSKFLPTTILDLGTGTGYIAEILLQYYPDSSYMLNDIAPNMIKRVQNKFAKYDKFDFCISDMEYENFQNYDLIISNLAFQWVSNLETTLKKFYSQSKIFAFACLLDGTFKSWENILKDHGMQSVLKQYPIDQDLINFLSTLKPSKYHFDIKNFHVTFQNAYSFIKYLQNLGASSSATSISLNGIKSLIKNYDQEFNITYKVFFGIMSR